MRVFVGFGAGTLAGVTLAFSGAPLWVAAVMAFVLPILIIVEWTRL